MIRWDKEKSPPSPQSNVYKAKRLEQRGVPSSKGQNKLDGLPLCKRGNEGDFSSGSWQARQQHRAQSLIPELWNLLDAVKDPEVPVLSLWDLGVLCDVQQDEHNKITVTITPTYSGCPAMDTMRVDIATTLQQAGFHDYEIKTQLAPAWTTDWLSPSGRNQLQEYGIAPPRQESCAFAAALTPESGIECPNCHSDNTSRISEFGSTACKALFQCLDCFEPFDYFKQI